MATLSSFVFNVDSQNPPVLGLTLSSLSATVEFLKTESTFKTSKDINSSVFSISTLGTRISAITGTNVLSGYYSGWATFGIASNTNFIGTEYYALTSAYSIPALSSQYATLTSSFAYTSAFGTGRVAGTYTSPVAILFNEIGGASTNLVTLSVARNIQFRVSESYHGQIFALQYSDKSSSLFTVNTASALQTLTGTTFDVRGPNEIRRFAIEG
jgi:hypothetical protein